LNQTGLWTIEVSDITKIFHGWDGGVTDRIQNDDVIKHRVVIVTNSINNDVTGKTLDRSDWHSWYQVAYSKIP